MAEYIEREALICNIKNEIEQQRKMGNVFATTAFAHIKGVVDKFPSADVVEVVRCKDCKHKVVTESGRVMCSKRGGKSQLTGGWYGLTATDNDHFCSYGEKLNK